MAIHNGVNGHTNGNVNASTKSDTPMSSTLSDLFDENIIAKILYVAETSLINNVRSNSILRINYLYFLESTPSIS